jgi:excisionase family DNA binding protein
MKPITTKQAAAILNVAQSTVTSYIANGDILATKHGHTWAVDKASVIKFAEKRAANPADIRPSVAQRQFTSVIGTPSKKQQAINAAEYEDKFKAAKLKWLANNGTT